VPANRDNSFNILQENPMRNRLYKLISACLTSLVLFSFLGCGEKPKQRIVEDNTQQDPAKSDRR
jgi:hypothetical protein